MRDVIQRRGVSSTFPEIRSVVERGVTADLHISRRLRMCDCIRKQRLIFPMHALEALQERDRPQLTRLVRERQRLIHMAQYLRLSCLIPLPARQVHERKDCPNLNTVPLGRRRQTFEQIEGLRIVADCLGTSVDFCRYSGRLESITQSLLHVSRSEPVISK